VRVGIGDANGLAHLHLGAWLHHVVHVAAERVGLRRRVVRPVHQHLARRHVLEEVALELLRHVVVTQQADAVERHAHRHALVLVLQEPAVHHAPVGGGARALLGLPRRVHPELHRVGPVADHRLQLFVVRPEGTGLLHRFHHRLLLGGHLGRRGRGLLLRLRERCRAGERRQRERQ
jgi:hypothetical protein